MAERRLELALDEHLARRLCARAADVGRPLAAVAEEQLVSWLGRWGLRLTAHLVRPGETLVGLARRYYGDSAKASVVAAFNGLDVETTLCLGQVVYLPEVGAPGPLPLGESPYIFGLHDRGGEQYMGWAGRKGWVVISEALGCDPADWSSASYADLSQRGYGVIVRLNHGYHEAGTLPRPELDSDFAVRCGNFCERSEGCHIWVIANEMNLASERPGGPHVGDPITPERYAQAFHRCRQEIRGRPGHGDDQVVTGAVGPWNVETTYPANPIGDWIVYFEDMLAALDGELDGIALHTYGRDADPLAIASELHMDPPFEARRKLFRTYRDFLAAIPHRLRHLPVYITETDQNVAWLDADVGWVRAAYGEIADWNADPTHQHIRCLALYRWERYPGDMWHIRGKARLIGDWRAALLHDYRWHD